MPETRLTPRKRAFVEAFLTAPSATEAAREAGYAKRSAAGTAHRLMQDPKVQTAIAERQAELRDRNAITADAMMAQFDEDRAFAIKTENAAAAVRASELKAKLAGLLVERRDVRQVGGFVLRVEGIEA